MQLVATSGNTITVAFKKLAASVQNFPILVVISTDIMIN